jgi:hypothetical protein
MAKRKPTKEEAKRRIDELPIIPKLGLPIGGPTLGELAKAFVDVDPLGRTAPSQDAVIEAMVNEPTFKLSPDQVDLINNDSRMVAQVNGEMVEIPSSVVRRGVIGPGQFDRSRMLPRTRTRKKTKTDKNMSKALREANARLRTKNGKLRKGKTQGDVMRLAHRLRKKMS